LLNREKYLIDRLESNYIGDDGAIVGDTIYSMDGFYEGVHFKREWMSLSQIARKAMIVNISDAIAMSAKPKYALVTLSIPKDFTKKEIDEVLISLQNTAREFECEIIGGDTLISNILSFSITIISTSKNPLTRKGLEVGDYLAYTGELGGSKRDLERLFRGEMIEKSSRFIEPILRGDFIYRTREFLSAGMDISDGLFCDTNKLLDYNNLGFIELIKIDDDIGRSGEEYEMLIGFREENREKIEEIANSFNLKLTIFGKIADNKNRFKCIDYHQ